MRPRLSKHSQHQEMAEAWVRPSASRSHALGKRNWQHTSLPILCCLVLCFVFSAIQASNTTLQEESAENDDQSPILVKVSVAVDDSIVRLIFTHDREVTRAIIRRGSDVEVVYDERVQFQLPELSKNSILNGFDRGKRRLRLKTGNAFESYERFDLKNPDRMILALSTAAVAQDGSPEFSGSGRDAPSGSDSGAFITPGDGFGRPPTGAPSEYDGIAVVVIDPGHGGTESGATGYGYVEKDLTLQIARRLRDRLRGMGGVRVVLTRDEDRTVGHDDRAAIANQHRADLFLSIHVNASPRSTAYGAETYYLSNEATGDAARTSVGVRSRSQGTGADDLDLVLWDLAQTRHLARSSALAEAIQSEMNALVGTRDRGVRQAPFRVLKGATMPAVLVEVGFISNKSEAIKLGDGEYQDRIAESLSRAIQTFLADWQKVVSPIGGP